MPEMGRDYLLHRLVANTETLANNTNTKFFLKVFFKQIEAKN